MKIFQPKLKSTVYSDDLREWVPSSFESFLTELDYIISSCEGEDPVPLFRGQTNYEWFVDSTFVRNCIQHIFTISDYHKLNDEIRHTVSFHRAITSLLLLKFGTACKPSQELFEREKHDVTDPLFHPPKQTLQPRSINQVPVYIAQMDFRHDLADIWAPHENEKRVFIKLILSEDLKNSAVKYLESQGATEDFAYPE